MSRPSPLSGLALFLLLGVLVTPSRADDPPVAPAVPAAPAVETPDFPGAVWAPAAPENFKPSARPSAEQPIDRIVIHDIEGPAMAAVRWFQNPKAQVSSHYVIDALTGTVYQQVKERDVAWHAGDRITNARSVGIEHGGYAYRPGFFSVTQYEASARLVRDISRRHNIPRDREHIIGHFEVPDSANPGKFGGRGGHTDPGPYWDWDYFMTLVRNDVGAAIYYSGIAPLPTPPIILHPGETAAATFPPASSQPQDPENAPTTFSLENAGDDPWLADRKDKQETERRKAGTVFLGTANGQDSRLAAADWISPRYVGSSADGDIAPGSSGKFAVSLRAPADFLGEITETFRLVNVPPAPRQPVPFGHAITLSVRVETWDIMVPVPALVPSGWSEKVIPGGPRLFWRRSVASATSLDKEGAKQSVVWETRLPVAGEWDVYVRYPVGAGRAGSATYNIGKATKKISQKTGGGHWRKLGRYIFNASTQMSAAGTTFSSSAPGTGPVIGTVSLEATTPVSEILVAGDVRFVGPFPETKTPALP